MIDPNMKRNCVEFLVGAAVMILLAGIIMAEW